MPRPGIALNQLDLVTEKEEIENSPIVVIPSNQNDGFSSLKAQAIAKQSAAAVNSLPYRGQSDHSSHQNTQFMTRLSSNKRFEHSNNGEIFSHKFEESNAD